MPTDDMQARAEELAKKLTKPQRLALAKASLPKGAQHVGFSTVRVHNTLRRMFLVSLGFDAYGTEVARITQLGRAVLRESDIQAALKSIGGRAAQPTPKQRKAPQ